MRGGVTASHHALPGHGLSVPVIRRNPADTRISIVLDLNVAEAASEAPGMWRHARQTKILTEAAKVTDGRCSS